MTVSMSLISGPKLITGPAGSSGQFWDSEIKLGDGTTEVFTQFLEGGVAMPIVSHYDAQGDLIGTANLGAGASFGSPIALGGGRFAILKTGLSGSHQTTIETFTGSGVKITAAPVTIGSDPTDIYTTATQGAAGTVAVFQTVYANQAQTSINITMSLLNVSGAKVRGPVTIAAGVVNPGQTQIGLLTNGNYLVFWQNWDTMQVMGETVSSLGKVVAGPAVMQGVGVPGEATHVNIDALAGGGAVLSWIGVTYPNAVETKSIYSESVNGSGAVTSGVSVYTLPDIGDRLLGRVALSGGDVVQMLGTYTAGQSGMDLHALLFSGQGSLVSDFVVAKNVFGSLSSVTAVGGNRAQFQWETSTSPFVAQAYTETVQFGGIGTTAPIASISETAGASGETFKVSLSSAASYAITLGYQTVNGTALAGRDFAAGKGSVTIAAGQTSATVNIANLGGTQAHAGGTFSLAVSGNLGSAGIGNVPVFLSTKAQGVAPAYSPASTVSVSGEMAHLDLAGFLGTSVASLHDVTASGIGGIGAPIAEPAFGMLHDATHASWGAAAADFHASTWHGSAV